MHTRRIFLKQATAAAAIPVLFGCSGLDEERSEGAASSLDDASAQAEHFRQRGFAQARAQGLITPEQFNGGLRYEDPIDDFGLGGRVRVQVCARLEDLGRNPALGTLARFHMLGLSLDDPSHRGQLVEEILVFLVDFAGLDPDELVVVSTDWVEPYRAILGRFGISADRILVRPMAEALAAGDGSGYFNPPGHPRATRSPTLSLHYPVLPGARAHGSLRSLDGYVELAEIGLREGRGQGPVPQRAGIGIERVCLARGASIPTFEQSRLWLLEDLEREAEANALALPVAYGVVSRARGV